MYRSITLPPSSPIISMISHACVLVCRFPALDAPAHLHAVGLTRPGADGHPLAVTLQGLPKASRVNATIRNPVVNSL